MDLQKSVELQTGASHRSNGTCEQDNTFFFTFPPQFFSNYSTLGFADGYISVMNVELNIKEMLELGKKAQAAGRGGNLEGDTVSIGSRYRAAHWLNVLFSKWQENRIL